MSAVTVARPTDPESLAEARLIRAGNETRKSARTRRRSSVVVADAAAGASAPGNSARDVTTTIPDVREINYLARTVPERSYFTNIVVDTVSNMPKRGAY